MTTPGHRRVCQRCDSEVIRVYTDRPPQLNVDLAPTPCRDERATGPYFRRLADDTFTQVSSIDVVGGVARVPAGATLVPHHCAPPARCRHCEQVHEVAS
jgi:hypothetical protein